MVVVNNADTGACLGAGPMMAAGLVDWFLAVDAERRSLEDLAFPLSAVDQPAQGNGRSTVAV
jgi:hypothetical protein